MMKMTISITSMNALNLSGKIRRINDCQHIIQNIIKAIKAF